MEFSNRQRAAGWGREISMGGSWNFPIPKKLIFLTRWGFDVKVTNTSSRTFLVAYLLFILE